jgi:hypothetical protein
MLSLSKNDNHVKDVLRNLFERMPKTAADRQIALSARAIEQETDHPVDVLVKKRWLRKIATATIPFYVLAPSLRSESRKTPEETQLEQEAEEMARQVDGDWRSVYQEYISSLHDYNEVKDAGQHLLGRLALLRQTTTRALYDDFDLEMTD